MWKSRVLRRAFERLELHEGKLSRAVLRGGGGGDVTSLPDPWWSNPLGPPGPELTCFEEPVRSAVVYAPFCSACKSLVPMMLPRPVHAFQPGVAGYPVTPSNELSVAPGSLVTSRKAVVASE